MHSQTFYTIVWTSSFQLLGKDVNQCTINNIQVRILFEWIKYLQGYAWTDPKCCGTTHCRRYPALFLTGKVYNFILIIEFHEFWFWHEQNKLRITLYSMDTIRSATFRTNQVNLTLLTGLSEIGMKFYRSHGHLSVLFKLDSVICKSVI